MAAILEFRCKESNKASLSALGTYPAEQQKLQNGESAEIIIFPGIRIVHKTTSSETVLSTDELNTRRKK